MNVDDPTLFEQHPLWRFSVRHYALAGVTRACLHLQDRHGLDVNVLLACIWWERSGGEPLTTPRLHAMLACSSDAREEVQHHRMRRRAAKRSGIAVNTEALVLSELQAENRVQRRLCDALGEPLGKTTGTGQASLERYARDHAADAPASLLKAVLATNDAGPP